MLPNLCDRGGEKVGGGGGGGSDIMHSSLQQSELHKPNGSTVL